MFCPGCGEYFFGLKNCPDCPPVLSGRQKIGNLTRKQLLKILSRHGWKMEKILVEDDSKKLSYLMSHEMLEVGPVSFSVEKSDACITYVCALVVVAKFDRRSSKLIKNFVNRLNGYVFGGKFFILDDVVFCAVTIPMVKGCSEDEMVFLLESEFIAIEQFMGMRDSLDEEDLEFEQAGDKQPNELN